MHPLLSCVSEKTLSYVTRASGMYLTSCIRSACVRVVCGYLRIVNDKETHWHWHVFIASVCVECTCICMACAYRVPLACAAAALQCARSSRVEWIHPPACPQAEQVHLLPERTRGMRERQKYLLAKAKNKYKHTHIPTHTHTLVTKHAH